MQMKEFDRDFVERTKWIIQNVTCQYEVTLLLNCMLGLVNLPTERTSPRTTVFQSECVQKLHDMGVLTIESSDPKEIFRSVRNAISHFNIHPTSQGSSINKVVLSDASGKGRPPHTQLEFTVEQLKKFALFVADKHLERFDHMQNRQSKSNS